MLRPLLSLFKHRLRHKTRYTHHDDGGHNRNDDIGKQVCPDHVPRGHQPHGGRDEHDGHDLDEKAGRIVHVVQLDQARDKAQEHQHKAVDARRDRQRQQKVEQLAHERNEQNDAELFDVFHDFSLLCVVLLIVRREKKAVNRRSGGIPAPWRAFLWQAV